MILYQYPGGDGLTSLSPPCVKIEMALRRLGQSFEIINCRSSLEARKISPSGRLPVLELDGTRIADSIVIMDRLEQRFEDHELFSGSAAERALARVWEHFAVDHLYWLGFHLRWRSREHSALFRQAAFGRLPWPARAMVSLLFAPAMARRADGQGVGAKSVAEVHELFERALWTIESGLSAGPCLAARETPGRGDLAVVSVLVQAGFRKTMPEAEAMLRARQRLVGYMDRVLAACSIEPPRWMR